MCLLYITQSECQTSQNPKACGWCENASSSLSCRKQLMQDGSRLQPSASYFSWQAAQLTEVLLNLSLCHRTRHLQQRQIKVRGRSTRTSKNIKYIRFWQNPVSRLYYFTIDKYQEGFICTAFGIRLFKIQDEITIEKGFLFFIFLQKTCIS